MMPDAVLIQQPAIDFTTFLGLSHEMLGYSLASAADASRRQLSDTERFLSCLAAMRDSNADAGLTPNLFSHVTFSGLVVAEERDLLDILELASMPFVQSETVRRGIHVAVLTGTLAQWRDAVKSGCSPHVESNARICFNKILGLFERAGLNVWADCGRTTAKDRTLLLEDKRR